jgi:hypothetical protein
MLLRHSKNVTGALISMNRNCVRRSGTHILFILILRSHYREKIRSRCRDKISCSIDDKLFGQIVTTPCAIAKILIATTHLGAKNGKADYIIIMTANAAVTNGLTCLPKHGGVRDKKILGHPSDDRPLRMSLNYRDCTRRAIEHLHYNLELCKKYIFEMSIDLLS